MRWTTLILCWLIFPVFLGGKLAHAQIPDTIPPGTYTLIQLGVEGTQLDDDAVRAMSGLPEGDAIEVPTSITKAIKRLWDQRLFEQIDITCQRIDGERIWLNLIVKDRLRLGFLKFEGITRNEADKLRKQIDFETGDFLENNWKQQLREQAGKKDFFKGYQTHIIIHTDREPGSQYVEVTLQFQKGKKQFVGVTTLTGGELIGPKTIRRTFKYLMLSDFHPKEKKKRFQQDKIDEDLLLLEQVLLQNGYKDVDVVTTYDTSTVSDDLIIYPKIQLTLNNRYYLGNITWAGNKTWTTDELQKQSKLLKGSLYNPSYIQERLYASEAGDDISSIYFDAGLLFFRLQKTESIRGDTIDLTIHITEGEVATINEVNIVGNVRTNDEVIRREISTRPGDIFTRRELRKSIHRLRLMNLFNPDSVNVKLSPNTIDNTVDITYHVKEVINDKLNLQASYGGERLYGTIGIDLVNFSSKSMFKKGTWKPFPAGDGERLQLNAQTNGVDFYMFNFSLMQPWVFGKGPTAAHHNAYYSSRIYSDTSRLDAFGFGTALSMKLFPKDNFTRWRIGVNYQHYDFLNDPTYGFDDGPLNDLSFTNSLIRNATNHNLFPTKGHFIQLDVRTSLPINDPDWMANYKTKFQTAWYVPMDQKQRMVLHTKAGFGLTGKYKGFASPNAPDRFLMGGSGFLSSPAEPVDLVGLRGYRDGDISAISGDLAMVKYTLEMRYLLWSTQGTSGWVHLFGEAGNTFATFDQLNPFDLKRSYGAGIRLNLPMLGVIGFDYGRGLDLPDHEDAVHSPGEWVPTVTLGLDLGKL